MRLETSFALSAVAALGTAACGSVVPAYVPLTGEAPAQKADRCELAPDRLAPLVTHWKAEDRIRFEDGMVGGAIAVAYSGCSLRIVDRCKLNGTYTWKQLPKAS